MGTFYRQRLYPSIFKLQRIYKEQFLLLKIQFLLLKIKGLKMKLFHFSINFKFLKWRSIFHAPSEKNYIDKNIDQNEAGIRLS